MVPYRTEETGVESQMLFSELAGGAQVDFVGPLASRPGGADPNP